MTDRYKNIFPGTVELIGLLLISIVVVFIGNSKQLLDYYGLSTSNLVIKQSAGDAITSGLAKLDNYSVTNQVVTFIIWAVIGLLCFSIAQAIAKGYHEFQLDEELSSNRYIHPKSFRRRAFWQQVGANFIALILGLGLLLIGLYAFLAYILPVSLTYTRVFLQGVSAKHIGYFLLGFTVLFIGIVVLDLCVRFLAHRQRLLS